MLAYKVRVLAYSDVSRRRMTIETSEPVDKERSGNFKMLTVSLMQSGSSV